MEVTGALQFAARDLALDQLALKTLALLRAADVDALLIKGPVTTSRLYADEPYRRHYTDVDLLVCPDDFDRAGLALAGGGYRRTDAGTRPSERAWRETGWRPPGEKPLAVDLHRSLAYVDDPAALWGQLWADRVSLVLQGGEVMVPSLGATALIVAVHASSPAKSRQPYADLTRAIEVFDDATWADAVRLARCAGALLGLQVGLNAVPAGRPMVRALALTLALPDAIQLQVPALYPAGAAASRVMALTSWKARWKLLADRAIPSEAFMRKAWPTSSTGRWGLVRSHLYRWSRMLRTLPGVAAELRRLRRHRRSPSRRWTVQALLTVRSQLAQGGLDEVDLPSPGSEVTADGVETILDRDCAGCLERSLILQTFHASRGSLRDLVIGVSPPDERFHAHAWLAGEDPGGALHEIIRRSPRGV